MNILVCISKTPETTARIAFTDDNKEFDTDGVSFIMNPYDEWYALVRALELKEADGGKVTVLNVGDSSNDTVIRKALAIGADEAVRIDAEPGSPMYTAFQIAEYVKDNEFDLVFLGKETIDYNSSEVGSMVAEYLDLPFISYASKLEKSGEEYSVKRDIEGGTETLALAAPFVLSAAKGLAEQRIPNMRGIMMAKRKPLNVVQPKDFKDNIKIEAFALPEDKGEVTMIDPENMEELVRLLHEEAKVI